MAVDSTAQKYKPLDGGYGWVVAGVGFTMFAIMTVLLSSFGVMYMEYVEAFDSSVVVVGTVVSYQALAANFAGLLCSGLFKLFDIRLVAMTGSLISACFCFVASFSGNMAMLGITYTGFGIGVGITFVSVTSVVQQYFDKKRTMANGFVMAGFSLGNFCYPPLARLGLDTLGWRMTLSLCACLLMQNVWLCAFLRPPIPVKKDRTQKTENAPATSRCTLCSKCMRYLRSLVDTSFLKDPVFLLFLVSSFCLSVSFIGSTIHLVNKALSEGIQRYNAAFVASTAGIINAIWRPVFGFIATIPIIRKNKDLVLSCLLLSFGLSLGGLAAANTFTTVMIAICFVSLSIGSISTLHLPTFADMTEPEKLPGAIGLLMAFNGMGQFCGPPLAGWAYDVTNNYDIAYYLLGGFSIVGSLANCLIIPVKKKRKLINKRESDDACDTTLQNVTTELKRTRNTTVNSLVGSTLNLAM